MVVLPPPVVLDPASDEALTELGPERAVTADGADDCIDCTDESKWAISLICENKQRRNTTVSKNSGGVQHCAAHTETAHHAYGENLLQWNDSSRLAHLLVWCNVQ